MPNTLSFQLLEQLFAQESNDPFLTLVTLSHSTFDSDIHLVNNTKSIVSRGNTYAPFPMKIRLPIDDGESARDFTLEMDNVSLELIKAIRSVTTQIGVKMEMILASMPDVVQMEQSDLLIVTMTYDAHKITARVVLDSFLAVEITSEKYNPSNFPGIF